MSAFPSLVITFLAVIIRKHSLFLFHPIFRKELLELYYAALTQLTSNVKSISLHIKVLFSWKEWKQINTRNMSNQWIYYMMQNTKI